MLLMTVSVDTCNPASTSNYIYTNVCLLLQFSLTQETVLGRCLLYTPEACALWNGTIPQVPI